MWSFETDPEFQKELDWIAGFVRDRIEPLDHVLGSQWNIHDPMFQKLVRPLQAEVKARNLWACHLGPHLGGKGYGQLKLALMNEQLGRSRFGPITFGTQAPDTGNSEILAHFGTPEQKERFLTPLLNNEIVSCFAMTEPQGGADPGVFTCRAEKDGDEWVINGYKFFSSNARTARFLIVMCVTNPDVPIYKGMSMFLVPTDTPGVDVERHVGLAWEGPDEGMHALIHYNNCRVPAEALLGGEGQAFQVAQTRLGGGRVHHAMRTVGACQRAFDLMCRRAVSRQTRDGRLADLAVVQEQIADCWIQLQSFRLLVLRTAWLIDKHKDYNMVRKDIAAIKVAMPKVYHDIATTAAHLHGAMGVSNEMPFMGMVTSALVMGIADGPTEVHKTTVAKQVLKDYRPDQDLFPNYHLPKLKEAALDKYGAAIEELKAQVAKAREDA